MKEHVKDIIIGLTLAISVVSSVPVFAGTLGDKIIAQTNEIRAEYGMDPLETDAALTSDAEIRAEEAEESFSHTRPDGQPFYTAGSGTAYGENLSKNFTEADEMMDAWMASPSHRDNILGDYTHMGVGVVYEETGATVVSVLFY